MVEQSIQYRSAAMMDDLGDGRCILCGDMGVVGDLCHQCGMDECRYIESHSFEPWEYPEGATQRFVQEVMGDDEVVREDGNREDPPRSEAADGSGSNSNRRSSSIRSRGKGSCSGSNSRSNNSINNAIVNISCYITINSNSNITKNNNNNIISINNALTNINNRY